MTNKRVVGAVLGLLEEGMSLEQLAGVIAQAQHRAIEEGFRSISLDIDKETGYYGDVSVTLQIHGIRDETDAEATLREATERYRQEQQRKHTDKRRLATYRRLRRELKKEGLI